MKSVVSASLLYVIAVSASPSLVLDIVAPPSVVDVNALAIKTSVKNVGDEPVKLLNDPRTVLSTTNTDTFRISSASGSPTFTGIRMKYVPSKAAELEDSFTVLAPGQSVEKVHSLAGVYNFTQPGEGLYNGSTGSPHVKIATSTDFMYIDPFGALQSIQAISNSHQFQLAGVLAVPNDALPVLSRRAPTYTNCNASQQRDILAAAVIPDQYVREAKEHFSGGASADPNRYTNWFGTPDDARETTVAYHFTKIDRQATSNNYDCGRCGDDPRVYAYVYPNEPGTIYLCGAFWKAPTSARDSRAGTIVRENSHFTDNGGTKDITYGEENCQELAQSSPEDAVMNADSHEYFVEPKESTPM
ncbi:hypothetical protein FRC09_008102 [Ceratobasidium sp. 395]|nr:hypothetical protein FRC09_008102 [Ceratobasidium sp. 395]